MVCWPSFFLRPTGSEHFWAADTGVWFENPLDTVLTQRLPGTCLASSSECTALTLEIEFNKTFPQNNLSECNTFLNQQFFLNVQF